LNISVIGTGYVGLITAITFAKKGHKVICVDIAPERVEMINHAKAPFFEPGLEEYLRDLVGSHDLWATADTAEAVHNSDLTFICVGTPHMPDGSQDISYVTTCSKEIGSALKTKDGYHLVVVKSTVEPGTSKNAVLPLISQTSGKEEGKDFSVAHNPEFLREGSALNDSFNPDRVVLGVMDDSARELLLDLYSNFECSKVVVDTTTSEMIKYASNSFLATKISFANEMANICQHLGIDVVEMFKGVTLDHRINPHFFNAGCGFGGSCFPKDISALIHCARSLGVQTPLLNSVMSVNDVQPLRCVELRETRALPLIQALLKEGAKVTGYDPQAIENFKKICPEASVEYTDDVYAAITGKDIAIVQSDWNEIKTPIVIDGRRTFDPKVMEGHGITYRAIGLGK
jgi:UDPglucose 6-dehydrogenase